MRRGGKHSGLIILDSKSGGQKICCPEYRTHKAEIWFQTGIKNLHFLSRVFSKTLMVNRPLRIKSLPAIVESQISGRPLLRYSGRIVDSGRLSSALGAGGVQPIAGAAVAGAGTL